MGSFEESYLEIPSEIIRLTIKTNQKCFVTRKPGAETLSNRFILVSNIEAKDGGKEIAHGNGKVVRARLSDAAHFWKRDQSDLPDLETLTASAEKFGLDLKKPLDQRMAKLDALNVTFHAKLGTQGERVARIRSLAAALARLTGADAASVDRAVVLAKADLRTEAVGEFPELQGIMGHKYAVLQGEAAAVADAIEDHYKPQGPSDRVPTDPVSATVALADKLDTLVGFWAIDEKPTGSKDPYALRRAALGVIRLILEGSARLPLLPCFDVALAALKAQRPDIRAEISADLLAFFHDRLKVYLRDLGARYDLIDAVLAPDADDLLMIARRVEALTASSRPRRAGTCSPARNVRRKSWLPKRRRVRSRRERRRSTVPARCRADAARFDQGGVGRCARRDRQRGFPFGHAGALETARTGRRFLQ